MSTGAVGPCQAGGAIHWATSFCASATPADTPELELAMPVVLELDDALLDAALELEDDELDDEPQPAISPAATAAVAIRWTMRPLTIAPLPPARAGHTGPDRRDLTTMRRSYAICAYGICEVADGRRDRRARRGGEPPRIGRRRLRSERWLSCAPAGPGLREVARRPRARPRRAPRCVRAGIRWSSGSATGSWSCGPRSRSGSRCFGPALLPPRPTSRRSSAPRRCSW